MVIPKRRKGIKFRPPLTETRYNQAVRGRAKRGATDAAKRFAAALAMTTINAVNYILVTQ
jgi:hypothetical protein